MPNNGFKWRPNDNSSKTLLRYDLEAEKWVNSVNKAIAKNKRSSLSNDLAVIGMFFQLIVGVVLLILLLILQGLHAIIKLLRGKTEIQAKKEEMRRKGYPESAIELLTRPSFKPKRRNILFFDSTGKLWALWQFILWFIFIFSFTFFFTALVVPLFDPEFDSTEEPFLYFIGILSVYFALQGID